MAVMHAHLAQATGHIERVVKTLQNRLVKDLHPVGIAAVQPPISLCWRGFNSLLEIQPDSSEHVVCSIVEGHCLPVEVGHQMFVLGKQKRPLTNLPLKPPQKLIGETRRRIKIWIRPAREIGSVQNGPGVSNTEPAIGSKLSRRLSENDVEHAIKDGQACFAFCATAIRRG